MQIKKDYAKMIEQFEKMEEEKQTLSIKIKLRLERPIQDKARLSICLLIY